MTNEMSILKVDNFAFFKIFLKKVFSLTNILFLLFTITLTYLVAVTVVSSDQFFGLALILSTLLITMISFGTVFFGFRNSHYYNNLKSIKFFYLKIYTSLFFSIFLLTVVFLGYEIFLTWIFGITDFLIMPRLGETEPLAVYKNFQFWQWGFIIYEFILLFILSFTICVFVQSFFNTNGKFLTIMSFLVVWFTFDCAASVFRDADYTGDAVYLQSGSNYIFLEMNEYQYYNPETNTLYTSTHINDGRCDFFSFFSFITNPFYGHSTVLDVATGVQYVDPSNDYNYYYVAISEEGVVLYELPSDFTLQIQFFQQNNSYNLVNGSGNIIPWLVYLCSPYFWIIFFIIVGFITNYIKNSLTKKS